MVERNKDEPLKRTSEEVKREMIEYLTGSASTEVRRLAFFDLYDRQSLKSKITALTWELHNRPDEYGSRISKESNLRVAEYGFALLYHQIANNNRISGYRQEFERAENFFTEMNNVVYIELAT